MGVGYAGTWVYWSPADIDHQRAGGDLRKVTDHVIVFQLTSSSAHDVKTQGGKEDNSHQD